jgi:catechol 2,3-dioxygenase-like lactoylglutathione lyase family enzyme
VAFGSAAQLHLHQLQQHFYAENSMTEKVHGMHHIGITVPDLEEAIGFFKAVFGAIEVFRTGPFDVDANFMKNKLGASASSNIRDLAFLRCGEGTSVELFEYGGEENTAPPRRSSEVGGMHLCFEVEDVFASAERLRAQGVEMLDGPNLVEAGPLAGFNWIYFRAPWGLILEVASFDRLGYEENSPHRLWRPEKRGAQ